MYKCFWLAWVLMCIMILIWVSIACAHGFCHCYHIYHTSPSSTPLFRRGLAAVGRLGLPHTLSSPLRGGERVWLIHPSINASPSSPPLSYLLISYLLFSHAIPQPHLSSFTHTSTPPLYTSHKNAFLKSQIFYKKLASGSTTQVQMLLGGMGADLPCDSGVAFYCLFAHGSATAITHHQHPLPSSGGGLAAVGR